MKTDQHWMACKPLADVNLPAWVRAIQADALRYARTLSPSELRPIADELESKRDEFNVASPK